MKTDIKYLFSGVVGLAFVSALWSCSDETPFDSDATGTVHLHTVVNSITTRADNDDAAAGQQSLRDNCVVYISGDKGLIYKKRGLDNVDESITLKAGSYVAEAWSGDSVTASFDKKFYRGYQPFDVSKGCNSNVVINCRIRNVVVSINAETIDPDLMQDNYVITLKNSRGSLTFTKDNAAQRGYFMMPGGDSKLDYSISGSRSNGESFTKEGSIEDVQPAHHYILNFDYNPGAATGETGAVFLRIKIQDEVLDTQNVDVPTAPSVSGELFNIAKQQVFLSDDAIPDELAVKICAFGNGMESVKIQAPSTSLPATPVNLLKADYSLVQPYKDAGISWTDPSYKESTKVSTCYVKFSRQFISGLSASATEHVINITVADNNGLETTVPLRIARSESAIIVEDPIVFEDVSASSNPMDVTGSTATLTFSLADDIEGTPGVEYCKNDGADNWTFVAISLPSNARARVATRAQKKYSVTLTGLETATSYKYRACCGDFHGDEVMSFTTESPFSLTNSSFEDWSTYSASTLLGTKTVILPGSTGNKSTSFWGSGNEGSATANMTLTDKCSDVKHSGTYSAKLESKSAMGVIAAGNLFVGEYVKTDGTNGVLSLGRQYNGSHPAKVRVYANYRPASNPSVKSGNEGFLPAGFADGKDHGQIYVALTTGAYEIRTNPSDRRLFDPDDASVIAYGQVTWSDNFGADGQLDAVEIPFDYNDRAKSQTPTHVVIVCSASKYGDFFSGAAGSVMIVDDFELVY